MVKLIKLNLLIGVLLLLVSCATSMSPIEVSNTLPTLTSSKYITQSEADEATKDNRCNYLVKGRYYVAPIGFTTKDDLKNGAKGIDEWVKLDGGNAYVLVNYKWVTVNNNGVTQLEVVFDTLLCK